MKSRESSNKGTSTLDSSESLRCERLNQINSVPSSRAALEQAYGQVWDKAELQRDFIVTGFLAPYVVVRRKDNSEVGSLEFQHQPRFYFNFHKDKR